MLIDQWTFTLDGVTTPPATDVAHVQRRKPLRIAAISATVASILALLFGYPWWSLVIRPDWPTAVTIIGTVVFAALLIALPATMVLSNGHTDRDRLRLVGDALLGIIWVVFVWTLLGEVLRLGLLAGGVENPLRARIVAVAALIISVVLLIWGYREAMRLPRIKHVDVTIPRLGAGMDKLRVVAITDTHFGPINRAKWSASVVAAVNELDADIVAHVGDIADGTVEQRRNQSSPLASVDASLARVYVTGNHEYFHEAQEWLDYMTSIGWDSLHNRHIVVTKGGDRLVIAGVDDATALGSRLEGHGANFEEALTGADPDLPILMLAHQPKQVPQSAAAGVDLQLAGHTHGGQIWPFNLLVKLDQPSVSGLSRHGDRTQLYTSRGTGFWGPPFRVFAPSEITVLTLHSS